VAVGLLGTLFVGALKAVAPVLVLMLVMASIANHQQGQKTSIRPILFLYLLGTLRGVDRGVVQLPLSVDAAPERRGRQHHAAVGDRRSAARAADEHGFQPDRRAAERQLYRHSGVGGGFGFALRHGNDTTKNLINDMSHAVTFIVKVVIRFAPLGIFGLVSSTLATTGFEPCGATPSCCWCWLAVCCWWRW
jgi:serine/threonine transporter